MSATDSTTMSVNNDDYAVDGEKQHEYDDWRQHTGLNPTLVFPTLLVPTKELHEWMHHADLKDVLAKPSNGDNDHSNILQHITPRIKGIQAYPNKNGAPSSHKQLLLLPQTKAATTALDEETTSSTTPSIPSFEKVNELVESYAQQGREEDLKWGPPYEQKVTYRQLSFSYILSQLLPPTLSSIPTAFEQVGHVAHFNLKPQHMPYGKLIGDVLCETHPSIETVVTKVGTVTGKYRTFDLKILATTKNNHDNDDDALTTIVHEHGVSIHVNVGECYWCSRLEGDRTELIHDIVQKHSNTKTMQQRRHSRPLVVVDVFCGVGAICLRLTKQLAAQQSLPSDDGGAATKQEHQQSTSSPPVVIYANDWNAKAIEYFKQSIATNHRHLDPSLFHLSSTDAYEYLMEFGTDPTKPFPDHVLMNVPLDSPRFLGSLRWWSAIDLTKHLSKQGTAPPRFHVNTFAKVPGKQSSSSDTGAVGMAESVGGTSTRSEINEAAELAIDLIAEGLLPSLYPRRNNDDDEDSSVDDSTTNTQQHRRSELNDVFQANVSTRMGRDVAPGKVVVCVSFDLTPKLIQYMQGDFT